MPCNRRPSQWQRTSIPRGPERGTLTVEVELQRFRWGHAGKQILDVPWLRLLGPGLTILVGASGGGKSSLLKALAGVLGEYHGGTTTGRTVHRLHGEEKPLRIGYVPQDPMDGFLAFDAETELQLRLQAAGWRRAEAVLETNRRLESLNLEGRERLPFHDLSGGERKRLALRAAQAQSPHLLLLDEPLNHLDDEWRPLLLEDILGAAATSLVVAAVHDLDHWLDVATHVVVVDDGGVAWQGAPAAFSSMRDQHPALRERTDDRFLAPPRPHGRTRLLARNLAAIRGGPLFRELDLELPLGLHAITGPNGSGKTTLLRMLGGLERPDEGRVQWGPTDLADLSAIERAAFIAYHLEEPGRIFFLPTAQEELAFQPTNAGRDPFEVETMRAQAAQRFRLQDKLARHPATLSGGEQERLALACLDAAQPSLIILDEPTHGLDAQGWDDLLAFLERYRRDACIVLATHEAGLVRLADTVHRFDGERLLEIRRGTTSAFVEVVPRRPS